MPDAEPPRLTFELVTLFPELFEGLLSSTVIGKAITAGILAVHCTNPRDFAPGRYRQVDDTPYGGGPGMVMRVEPIAAALEAITAARGLSHRILLTPRGGLFDQAAARRLAARRSRDPHLRALRRRRRAGLVARGRGAAHRGFRARWRGAGGSGDFGGHWAARARGAGVRTVRRRRVVLVGAARVPTVDAAGHLERPVCPGRAAFGRPRCHRALATCRSGPFDARAPP